MSEGFSVLLELSHQLFIMECLKIFGIHVILIWVLCILKWELRRGLLSRCIYAVWKLTQKVVGERSRIQTHQAQIQKEVNLKRWGAKDVWASSPGSKVMWHVHMQRCSQRLINCRCQLQSQRSFISSRIDRLSSGKSNVRRWAIYMNKLARWGRACESCRV